MSTAIPDVPTKDRALSEFVVARVSTVQRRYSADEAVAVAALAQLRRGVGSRAGSNPALWDLTLAGLPEILADPSYTTSAERDGVATKWEQAAHDAITLHAWHQQSRTEPMHRRGVSLGAALRILGFRTSEEGVLRRFKALGTTDRHDARLTLLRGLISQLRAHTIAIDYGILARDLRQLDHRNTADQVLLRWGRDYHRTKIDDSDATAHDPTTPKGEDR
ncbi:type I-E CRISPR-associated protein Cse2/CasB [Nocardia sp. NPDC051832]|uniref:type I-E CRISPR-associated protein Cse2/CasB n=1 Tax=Nocardia sp. NPDC051832 TaxID=3155673 RepID=UPI003415CAFE